MILLSEIILFCLVLILILPLTIIVNKKLYFNLKNEEHLEKGKVVQFIVKTYSLVQCVAWPVLVFYFGMIRIVNEIKPVHESLMLQFLASTFRYLYTFLRDYLQFHSLIIAISRYTFTVYESKAGKIGIKRLRAFFIGASISVPFLTSTLFELTRPIEKIWIHWFYKEKFSSSAIYQNLTINYQDQDEFQFQSFAFATFNKNFPSAVIDMISYMDGLLFSIIYSNLIEGCIYTHIFVFFTRYEIYNNVIKVPRL